MHTGLITTQRMSDLDVFSLFIRIMNNTFSFLAKIIVFEYSTTRHLKLLSSRIRNHSVWYSIRNYRYVNLGRNILLTVICFLRIKYETYTVKVKKKTKTHTQKKRGLKLCLICFWNPYCDPNKLACFALLLRCQKYLLKSMFLHFAFTYIRLLSALKGTFQVNSHCRNAFM